jgi:hypothetical protein
MDFTIGYRMALVAKIWLGVGCSVAGPQSLRQRERNTIGKKFRGWSNQNELAKGRSRNKMELLTHLTF